MHTSHGPGASLKLSLSKNMEHTRTHPRTHSLTHHTHMRGQTWLQHNQFLKLVLSLLGIQDQSSLPHETTQTPASFHTFSLDSSQCSKNNSGEGWTPPACDPGLHREQNTSCCQTWDLFFLSAVQVHKTNK